MVDLRVLCLLYARRREGCTLRCCGRASGAALARRRGECTRFTRHCLRTLRRTCATIATLRRPSSVDAAILKGALLRSCLAGRATRGRPRDISALATPASIVILAIVLRIVTAARQQLCVSSLCSSMTMLPWDNDPRQSPRIGVFALLYRSAYRIKEPRQQPNEDSQRGPRGGGRLSQE